MKRFLSLLVIMVVLLVVSRARAVQQAMQMTVTGNGNALGYTAVFWVYGLGDSSTSGDNLFSGSGTFYQDVSNASGPVQKFGFVGLYGSFDGQTFTPTGVAWATTPTAAADIIANNKTFDQVFGESEQTFMDDIRTPISGLSFSGFFHWFNAEGSQVPIGTDATLLDFSNATIAGTVHAEIVSAPEPSGIAVLGLSALFLMRRRPVS